MNEKTSQEVSNSHKFSFKGGIEDYQNLEVRA